MEGKIDKLENAVQKLLKLAQPCPQGAAHYQGGNNRRDRAPGRCGRDWIKDEECFKCEEKEHFAKGYKLPRDTMI